MRRSLLLLLLVLPLTVGCGALGKVGEKYNEGVDWLGNLPLGGHLSAAGLSVNLTAGAGPGQSGPEACVRFNYRQFGELVKDLGWDAHIGLLLNMVGGLFDTDETLERRVRDLETNR